ncbi:MAG: hypothetical protein HWN65_10145 [Candidatus Helarchaeota archaeon]|nr:hypothetical protein [Candidatus Helarchaeota archaeon]
MNVETRTGIKISVINEENSNSKILMFDKPVQALELTLDEAIKLGTSMIRDKKIGITTELRKLKFNGYFKTPRSFKDIKNELQKTRITVKAASLNVILSKLVEKEELSRIGERRSYLYTEFSK